ncbi:MAG TPA: CaiB/BaiF CoA-transferase family protein [Candidatus Acidoferrales bacterium]|nr:CaiB/BaiF CoA-transferase family protein [Candidatus Acidoferrales bacterium]
MLLQGVRVLDLTRLLPGAYCSMLLADLGADVVKVEEPGAGDYMRWLPPLRGGQGVTFNAFNRNKRSLTLNLKAEDGRELFKKLAARADVVMEGNRPGVMDRLGLGYGVLKHANPKLVLCSITGYGQDGPFRMRAGHDLNYMATAGGLGLNAPPGADPHPLGVQVADLGGGGLQAAVAILAALLAVERGAEGRHLDVSMTDTALSWVAASLAQAQAQAAGEVAPGGGLRLTGRYACYRVYRCRDGRHYSVGALEPKFWQELCEAVGRPDLVPLQFAEGEDGERLQAELEAVFAARSRAEWEQVFEGRDVCCEPVLELDEVAAHPQVAARRLLRQEPTGLEVAPAVPLGPGWRRLPPPGLGEHNAEVLAEIGVDAAQLARLRAAGVV